MSNAPTKYVSSGKQNDMANCTCTISRSVLLLANMLLISLCTRHCSSIMKRERTSVAYTLASPRRSDADCTLWADSQSRNRP